MKWLPAITLILASLCVIAPADAREAFVDDGAADRGAFRAAAYAPPDATMLLHVTDAAGLRAELADRPIAAWFQLMLQEGELGRVWPLLAEQSGLAAGELFDIGLGREVTLIARQRADEDAAEWVLIAEIPRDRLNEILKRLRPKVLGLRMNMQSYELPEHELLLARRGDQLLVAPRAKAGLFDEVLPRLQLAEKASLADEALFGRLRWLGRGQLAVFKRHDRPLGGWSAVVARLDGGQLRLRHHASFDNPPFMRDVTRQRIDMAALEQFSDHTLAVLAEPTDTGRTLLETFITTRLGQPLLSKELRDRLAGGRLLVIGEIEGRREAEPVDVQAPTLALCFQMESLEDVAPELDRQMLRLAARINQLGGDRFQLEIPDEDDLGGAAARHVDLSPAATWLTGGLPIARPVSLNWAVTDGPHGQWCVIATHPQQLEDVLGALNAGSSDDGGRAGRVDSAGIASGARIGHHLRSWSERVDLFDAVSDRDEFAATLRMLATFADGLESARWRLHRPCRSTMCLKIDVWLTEPESVRPD